MTLSERRLIRHLGTAVTVKMVVLAVLWWCFVRDSHVAVDAEQAAVHVAGTPSGPGAKP